MGMTSICKAQSDTIVPGILMLQVNIYLAVFSSNHGRKEVSFPSPDTRCSTPYTLSPGTKCRVVWCTAEGCPLFSTFAGKRAAGASPDHHCNMTAIMSMGIKKVKIYQLPPDHITVGLECKGERSRSRSEALVVSGTVGEMEIKEN